MSKESKKVIIISSIVILVGVGVGIGLKVRKTRRERKALEEQQEKDRLAKEFQTPPIITPGASPNLSGAPAGVDIRAFQQFARDLGFLNVAGKNKGKLIDADGVWGTNSQAAWDQLSAKFLAKTNPAPSPTVAPPTVTPPTVTTTTKPTYNKDAYVKLAGRLHRAMQGAGTKPDFWTVLGYLKNQADYNALKSAFGVKQGATMFQWIAADMQAVERIDYNRLMKSKNIASQLNIE